MGYFGPSSPGDVSQSLICEAVCNCRALRSRAMGQLLRPGFGSFRLLLPFLLDVNFLRMDTSLKVRLYNEAV